MWQWTPFVVPVLLSGIVGVGVAAFAWSRRGAGRAARQLAINTAVVTGWTLTYAVMLLRADLPSREICIAVQYPFIFATPAVSLLLALYQSGRQAGRAWQIALWTPPAIMLAFAATNASHHLVSGPLELVPYDGYVLSTGTGGPIWYLFLLYGYLCVMVTCLIYAQGWLRGGEIQSRQSAVLLLGTLIPFIANLIYTFGPLRVVGFDPTSVSFLVTSLAYGWGFLRMGLSDLVPVGRDAVLSLLEAPVIVVDAQGRIADATPAVRRIADVPLVVGGSIDALAARHPALTPLLRDRKGRADLQFGEHAYEALARPLDEAGVVVLLVDITARKALEASTRAALVEAQRLSEARAEFLARMSHEVRTPLSAVIGSAELLSRSTTLVPGDAARVENLKEAAESLLELVDEVLDFSSLDAGTVRVSPKPFAPRELLVGLEQLFSGAAQRKSLRLELRSALDAAHYVGDPLRVRQVIANLITNAIKFTKAGSVTLDARFDDVGGTRVLVIEVIDTGVGISEDEIERVFEPFVQTEETARSGVGGTGLGLPISRRLAQAMGGTLTLTSTRGEGTRALLRVPLLPASSPATNIEAVPRGSRRALGHVLLVEDHPLNRQLAAELLDSLGCEVVTAGSAREVRLAIEARVPALVLMDLRLPDGDGRALTLELHEARPSLPIVALTADVTDRARASTAEAGMLAHLPKPMPLAELVPLLDRFLGPSEVRAQPADGARSRARLIETAPRELSAIGAALGAGRLDEATRLAHGLAGAAAIVGERELASSLGAVSRAEDLRTAEELLGRALRAVPATAEAS